MRIPFWLATQPKVHQIKMMGRFVHEKSATIVFISMPSSEIICPVLRIQQPFKVDRENIADYVFFQQFLYLSVIWRITIIESDSQIPSRLFWTVIISCAFSSSIVRGFRK